MGAKTTADHSFVGCDGNINLRICGVFLKKNVANISQRGSCVSYSKHNKESCGTLKTNKCVVATIMLVWLFQTHLYISLEDCSELWSLN